MSYSVAVRALCEFSAKVGDLDLRFTPSPTAQEGIEGHQRVVARRAAGYESEITLGCGGVLTVTTLAATGWKRSRPTVATWPGNQPTTASCTGRRPRCTAG